MWQGPEAHASYSSSQNLPAYPAGQRHPGCTGSSLQTPPCWQELGPQEPKAGAQAGPAYPGGQSHRKRPSPGVVTHVAFPRQGLGEHGSVALSQSPSEQRQWSSFATSWHVELFWQDFERHLATFLSQKESARKAKVAMKLVTKQLRKKLKNFPRAISKKTTNGARSSRCPSDDFCHQQGFLQMLCMEPSGSQGFSPSAYA